MKKRHLPSKRSVSAALLIVAVVVAALGACDILSPSDPSGPGSFHAELLSPNGLEAAAVFELAGGVELGVVTAPGGDAFWDHAGGTSRIVVVLDSPGVIRFDIRTENVRKLPTVTVIQVADAQDDLRPSLSGFEVDVVREEDGGSP
ncbi:hypothetical protein ACFL3S_11100 [Gemmatimonadota bacterium]